jgi:hypothetical protein
MALASARVLRCREILSRSKAATCTGRKVTHRNVENDEALARRASAGFGGCEGRI